MGDCYNLGIIQNDKREPSIMWLYAHNGFWIQENGYFYHGYESSIALALQEAKSRWDDQSYFARHIIHFLGDSVRGISSGSFTLAGHRHYVLDCKEQLVHRFDDVFRWNGTLIDMPEPDASISYQMFVDLYKNARALTEW